MSEKNKQPQAGELLCMCQLCKKSFTYENYIIHITSHPGEPFRCPYCVNSFLNFNDLSIHLKTHTNETAYKNEYGEKAFANRHNPTKDQRLSGEKRPFACKYCEKLFPDITSLTRHADTHKGETSYKFEFSDELFPSKDISQRQVNSHTGEASHVWDFCDDSFPVNSTLNKQFNNASTSKKPYKCEYCKKSFANNYHFMKHVKLHTGDSRYKCEYCGKSFLNNYRLVRHVRIHTGERPYKCEYCEKGFLSKYHLNRHERTHTGERPYKCYYCYKSFSNNYHRIKHMDTHTGKKPCKDSAEKSFSDSGEAAKLNIINPGETAYRCEYCDKLFSQRHGLNIHVSRCHTEKTKKPYKCQYCNKSFAKNSTANNHMRTHTGQYCNKLFSGADELSKNSQPQTAEGLFERKETFPDPNGGRRVQNEGRPYKCLYCNELFSESNALNKHIATHVKNTYKCEHCYEMFLDKDSLSQHCKLHAAKLSMLTEKVANQEMPCKFECCEATFSCNAFPQHLVCHKNN